MAVRKSSGSVTMGVKEFKIHASAVVNRAAQGSATVVTNRGLPVAIVLPFALDLPGMINARSQEFIERYRDVLSGVSLEDGQKVLEEMGSQLDAAARGQGIKAARTGRRRQAAASRPVAAATKVGAR